MTYRLYGAIASPYSLKMRAYMRYRRLSFIWRDTHEARAEATAKVKVPVIPILEFPDGTFANDSTVLIERLEAVYDDGRSAIPSNPLAAFLARFIEDFADEWLTKAMFGYRWLAEVDQLQMSKWLAFDNLKGAGGLSTSDAAAEQFRQRQVSRMGIVGCSEANWPIIEESVNKVLAALETHVTNGFFLFGSRPSIAEFGLYGQLSQFQADPTPNAVMRQIFPYTLRWLNHMDDLSGTEGDWSNAEQPATATTAIARIAAEYYLPYLAANAESLARGEAEFAVTLGGARFGQPAFPYQRKCLEVLRQRYRMLADTDRARLEALDSNFSILRG
jgi:glutathione S-transferase